MSPIISAAQPRKIITLNSAPSRLYSANSDTSSSVQASLNNLSASLKAPTTTSASGFAIGGQKGDEIKTKEKLIEAILDGKIKTLRIVLDPYNQVACYRVNFETTNGQNNQIKVVLPEDLKELRALCKERHIPCEDDTPGPTDWMRDFGKQAAIQVVAPLAVTVVGWFTLKYGKSIQATSDIKKQIIKPEGLFANGSKDIFELDQVRNHLVGVDRIQEFVLNAHDEIERFKATGDRGEVQRGQFGGTVGGVQGCGKSTAIRNVIRAFLKADKEAVAFELDEKGFPSDIGQMMSSVGNLSAKEKAKIYVKLAEKQGMKRIILYADDPEKNGFAATSFTAQLMKQVIDEAALKNIVVNCFIATNKPEEIFSGKNQHEIGALMDRLGSLYKQEGVDTKASFAYFYKDQFSENPHSDLIPAFASLERDRALADKKGNQRALNDILSPTLIKRLVKLLKDSGKDSSTIAREMADENSELRKRFISKIRSESPAFVDLKSSSKP